MLLPSALCKVPAPVCPAKDREFFPQPRNPRLEQQVSTHGTNPSEHPSTGTVNGLKETVLCCKFLWSLFLLQRIHCNKGFLNDNKALGKSVGLHIRPVAVTQPTTAKPSRLMPSKSEKADRSANRETCIVFKPEKVN